MSAQSSRESTQSEDEQPGEQPHPQPGCDTNLTGSGEWETRPAAVYPPGYMALCGHPSCFGRLVPDEAWNEDGSAEWDHTQVTDELVRSTSRGTARRYHLPDHVEVDDAR